MIIIEGPDHTGKSTLAQRLASLNPSLYQYYHFSYTSKYPDYMEPLSTLKFLNGILDRHMLSEIPYAFVMKRKFQYTTKQFHNVMMMTLAQNPLIILGNHRPLKSDYELDQYMPYEQWDMCMTRYLQFFSANHIDFIPYDYTDHTDSAAQNLISDKYIQSIQKLHILHKEAIGWAVPFWEMGCGFTGSPNPKVLIVAERIGPSNSHNFPFEEGPTGYMLSEVIEDTNTPLGDIAVTNLVKLSKSVPRNGKEYSRQPNDTDLKSFEIELANLKPSKVVFMGRISSKAGGPVCEKMKIPHDSIIHLGALNHQGITDLTNYKIMWKNTVIKAIQNASNPDSEPGLKAGTGTIFPPITRRRLS